MKLVSQGFYLVNVMDTPEKRWNKIRSETNLKDYIDVIEKNIKKYHTKDLLKELDKLVELHGIDKVFDLMCNRYL